uniref:Uncharacterized protein n=1 Tax=Nannospalax galili TaxID=1026970 RepID=A0A8C6RIX1_NANGA
LIFIQKHTSLVLKTIFVL